jgi:solute carrier family 35 protein E3
MVLRKVWVSGFDSVTIMSTSNTANPVEEDKWAAVRIPFYLALNACSSVGIVFANKVVFQIFKFKYGTLLTLIHFIFTFLGLEVCRRLGLIQKKRGISAMQILPLALSYCAFVVATNLSLLNSSIADYEATKLLTIPFLVFVQALFYNETFPLRVCLSLILICVGVASSTWIVVSGGQIHSPLRVSVLLLATCMHQIWVGTKQKELELSSFQLLSYHSGLTAILLIPLVPMLDDLSTLKDQVIDTPTIMAIFISSCLAFLVNISIFLVIGKTSPVTYNVLGHFKFAVLSFSHVVFLYSSMPDVHTIGRLITVIGVACYAYARGTQLPSSKARSSSE